MQPCSWVQELLISGGTPANEAVRHSWADTDGLGLAREDHLAPSVLALALMSLSHRPRGQCCFPDPPTPLLPSNLGAQLRMRQLRAQGIKWARIRTASPSPFLSGRLDSIN